jgi:hypothetical protein
VPVELPHNVTPPDSGPRCPVAGEFAFMAPLAFGISHDNVSANDKISVEHLWIREFRSGFAPQAQSEFDVCSTFKGD